MLDQIIDGRLLFFQYCGSMLCIFLYVDVRQELKCEKYRAFLHNVDPIDSGDAQTTNVVILLVEKHTQFLLTHSSSFWMLKQFRKQHTNMVVFASYR